MSHLRLWSIFTALVLCSASVSYSQVQTQASCTFTSFKAPGLLGGVNDYRSTVGQSSANPELGFIRYSNGSVTYFSPPNTGSTSFTGRNDAGVSAGFYTTHGSSIRKGFILHGSSFTSFSHPKGAGGTLLTGINKYNSTVGWYFDSANIARGFKRYSNGGLVSLNYPGASQGTTALDINDSGTVVGSFGGSNGQHGFL
jgi:hypothetical protein